MFAVAASLWAQDFSQPSKKELYARARDALKTALETQDFDRAGQALDYLRANVDNGAPLTRFEEYLAASEMGRFDEAVDIYSDLRRTVLDSAYEPPKDIRITENDALNLYLYKNLVPFDESKADSLVAHMDSTDLSQNKKDLYAALIYSELVVGVYGFKNNDKRSVIFTMIDTTRAEQFLVRAKKFVAEDEYSFHTPYMKRHIEGIENNIQVFRDFRKDPFKHKYYTGGLGVYLGKWLGFMSGEATDYLNDEMGSSFIFEGEIQFWRIALGFFWSYGLVTTPKYDVNYSLWDEYEDELMGFTLGVTVFDSRFLKVTPFIGIGNYSLMTMDVEDESEFLFGLNIDSHLLATTPSRIGGISSGLNLRFKYMAQVGEFSDNEACVSASNCLTSSAKTEELGGSFINHTFALELGLILW